MSATHKKSAAGIHQENKPLHISICGLHSAGKTTVLHSVNPGKYDLTYPIIGLDLEITVVHGTPIALFDEGGRSRNRALNWMHYRRALGLIFVIDSTDQQRIDMTREELHLMSNEQDARGKPLLILANKQDLSSAMTLNELQDRLNLTKLDGITKWHLQSTCAIRNEGIQEGLIWLTNSMIQKRDAAKPIVETPNATTTMQNYLKSLLNFTNLRTFFKQFI